MLCKPKMTQKLICVMYRDPRVNICVSQYKGQRYKLNKSTTSNCQSSSIITFKFLHTDNDGTNIKDVVAKVITIS